MSGDWIKMRMDLRRHPKVVRIASALDADRYRVIGGLLAVWAVFDEQTEDGLLEGYTPKAMDEEIGWPGFSAAMISVGWLRFDPENGLSMPEFDEHNGQSAKRRATEAKRKRKEREAESADGPKTDRKPSARDADKKRPREEVEKKGTSPSGEVRARAIPRPDDVFEQTWSDWLQLRKAKKAPVTETVLKSARSEAEKAGLPLDRFLAIWCARGSQGLQADWLKPEERRAGAAPAMNKQEALEAANLAAAERFASETDHAAH
jgi:hypothetical protein